MIYLGSIPILLDIFVVVVVLVWLFALADRLADRIGAGLRLHRTRLHSGGRASWGFLLSLRDARPPLHPSRRS